jgi:hypothetical protein
MMILRAALIILLLCPVLSMADGYIDELAQQIEEFNSVAIKNSEYGIYSPSELEIVLNIYEKIFFDAEVNNAINELRVAGRNFLVFLNENEDKYKLLSVDEWLVAVDLLLRLDDTVSRKIAWGNLIIKIAICNKIFYWIFDYIDSHDGHIKTDVLIQLLDIQKKLRIHYPSNTSMLYIAFRHYGINTELHVTDYALKTPYSKELVFLQKSIKNHFNDNNEELDKIKEITKNEKNIAVSGYVDLYDNPLPLLVAYRTDFYPDAWGYYEYSKLVLADSRVTSSKTVTKEILYDFLSNEYKGDGAFWMPYTAVDFIKKPEMYSNGYLNSINKELLLDSIKRTRRLVKQRKIIKANEIVGARLL